MSKDFFITYHHDDELAARWIADILLKVPFSLFMESWDLLPEGQPLEKIDYMLSRSISAIVLISERWLRTGVESGTWQPIACKYFGSGTTSLILLRIDSCDVPQALSDVPYTDLYGFKLGEAANLLLKAAGAAAPDQGKKESLSVVPSIERGILELEKNRLDQLLIKSIRSNYHMALELEAEVEKEVILRDEKTGRMKKRIQWVWEDITLEKILTDGNNYLLVNPSGMGKTTFLTYAACMLLDNAKDFPFVPLLTTCIDVNQRSSIIGDFIDIQLESLYKNTKTGVVKEDWENLCILIDALDQGRNVDEIVSSFLLSKRFTHYKKAKIILSSRQNTADKVTKGFQKIRLKLPLVNEVRQYLGDENYKKLEGHIQKTRELITVPVLLEMLKTITSKEGNTAVPKNRTDLYNEFTKILVDEEKNKPRFWQYSTSVHHFIENELDQVLEKISFFSLAENKILEIEKEKLVNYCGSPEKKEALLNIGILLEFFENREQKVVFRHQSFQAYFAARYMYYRRPDLFREITKYTSLFYSDLWYEVIRFFIGFERNPEKAEKIINLILNNDINAIKKIKFYRLNDAIRFIFADFLVSETQIAIEKKEILYEKRNFLLNNYKQYLAFYISNIDKLNPENDLQHLSLFEALSHLLKDKSRYIFNAASEALGKISTAKDIPYLEKLLKDESKYVRRAAVEILGKIGTSKDILLIEPLLMDEDYFVRHSAIYALGKIGTYREISILISLLRDENEDTRAVASEVLTNIDANIDITFLKALLSDENNDVRRTAVEILGKCGTVSYISLLDPLLGDKDANIRRVAAIALGKIGTDRDISLLKPLLSDLDDNVRRAAAEAFGNVGKNTDIFLIEPLLMDKTWEVRNAAVEALGKIDKDKVISLIKPLLKYKNARLTAIETLGKFGTSEHIPLLKPLIKDADASIRRAVALALGKIGTSNNIDLLKPILRDRNHWVRYSGAVALGDIGTAKNIKLLKPLLSYWHYGLNKMSFVDIFLIIFFPIFMIIKVIKNRLKKGILPADEDDHSRRIAAEVLGKIGTSKHAHLLKPILADKNSYVRRAGVEALGKIGNLEHILLLESMLNDYLDNDIHKSVARSIEQIFRRSTPKLQICPILQKKEEKKPISINTTSTKIMHILHISDIHYSIENDCSIKHIFFEFIKDIRKWKEQHQNAPIHAICLTGDIAFSGQKDQYASVHEWINEILQVTGCPQSRLFIIPGNHDVHEFNNFPEDCKHIMDEAVKDETYINRILYDYEKYRPFHDKFTHYYGYVETSCFANSIPETRDGKPKPWYSRRLMNFPVRIIGLNSALFCLKPYSDRDKIRMGKCQFEEAYFHGKPRETDDRELVLLLTHHPADWLRETEKEEYETLMDRYKVVHLHGHIHRFKSKLISTSSGSNYLLIGTGSIYGEKGTNHINTYHIMTLDFEKEDIHIWGRRWEPGYGFWTNFADNTRNVFPFPGKK